MLFNISMPETKLVFIRGELKSNVLQKPEGFETWLYHTKGIISKMLKVFKSTAVILSDLIHRKPFPLHQIYK
jgi:hypothetical protein